jgi:hypothetical protein
MALYYSIIVLGIAGIVLGSGMLFHGIRLPQHLTRFQIAIGGLALLGVGTGLLVVVITAAV